MSVANEAARWVRLMTLILGGTLLGGCRLFGPDVDEVKWAEGGPLTYQKVAKVTVTVAPGWFDDAGSIDLSFAEGAPLTIKEKSSETSADGRTRVTLDVIPIAVGQSLKVDLIPARSRWNRHTFKVDVKMPAFVRSEHPTFPEIVGAPNESIQGAQITLWSGEGRTFISGHAAPEICRVISAAITDYAVTLGLMDDSFFVGAGFASVKEDPSVRPKLEAELKGLTLPKDLKTVIAGAMASNKLAALTKSVGLGDRGDPVNALANLIETPPSPVDADATKHFLETVDKEVGEIRNIDEVMSWIQDPTAPLNWIKQQTSSSFDEYLPAIRHLAPTDRKAVVGLLRRYAAMDGSKTLLENKASELAQNAGMVETASIEDSQSESIVEGLGFWVKDRPEESQLSLADMRIDKRLMFMRDDGGIALLPFYENQSAEPLSFKIDKQFFFPSPKKGEPILPDVKEMFLSSINHDVIEELEAAATRQRANYSGASEQLRDIGADAGDEHDRKRWLATTHEVTYHLVDEFGRDTGKTRVEQVSNYSFWIGRLQQAESARMLAEEYRTTANRLREQSGDEKARRISEYTLIDAFLRGWQLAFVDNTKSSPYRDWLEQNRSVVWAEIFHQAAARGVDPAPLVSEQTVFQVRSEGDAYYVRPMFVGNFRDTVAIRDPAANLVGYSNPWLSRSLTYLAKGDVAPAQWQAAEGKSAEPLRSALLPIAEGRLESALSESDTAARARKLREALAISPSAVANDVLVRLWALVPEDDGAQAQNAEFKGAIDDGRNLNAYAAALSPADLEAFKRHVVLRAFGAGVRSLSCLSKFVSSVETSEGTPDKIRTQSVACLAPTESDRRILTAAGLGEVMAAQKASLDAASKDWKFDTLGKLIVRSQLTDSIQAVGRHILDTFEAAFGQKLNKRAARMQLRVRWYTGEYRAALLGTLSYVVGRTPEAESLARSVLSVQNDVLKALLYGDEDFDGHDKTSEIAFSESSPRSVIARGTPTELTASSVFEARYYEAMWAPKSIERIPVAVHLEPLHTPFPRSLAPASKEASFLMVRADVQKTGSEFPTQNLGSEIQADSRFVTTPNGVEQQVWIGTASKAQILTIRPSAGDITRLPLRLWIPNQASDVDAIATRLSTAGAVFTTTGELTQPLAKPLIVARGDTVDVLAERRALQFKLPFGTDVEAFLTSTLQGQARLVEAPPWAYKRLLTAEALRLSGGTIDPAKYYRADSAVKGLLGYSKDGKALQMLTRQDDETIRWVHDESGLQRKETGLQAVKAFQDAEMRGMQSGGQGAAFLHIAAFSSGDAHTTMTLGGVKRDIPIEEIRQLINGADTETPQLDALMTDPSLSPEQPFIIYRDGLSRGGAGGRGGRGGGDGKPPGPPTAEFPPDPDRDWMKGIFAKDSENVPPLALAIALEQKYGKDGRRILVDDERELALSNALNPIKISGPKDVGAYIASRSFRVVDHETIQGIRDELAETGVAVEESMQTLDRRELVVLTGHKDMALRRYVQAHIDAGNFKDRLVLLFSCYADGDADLAHRIVKDGGARTVVYFSDKIEPEAVALVMMKMNERLVALERTGGGSPVDALRLIDDSIAEASAEADDFMMENSLNKLRHRIMQVSSVAADAVAA